MTINVALIEDDERLRRSLISLFDGLEDFKCIGAFESAEEALIEIPVINPSVVLVDIVLRGMNGIECIRKLKRIMPDTQFIILTIFEDTDKIFAALKAGATGYLLKRTPTDQLLHAIMDVHNGGSPMSSQIARKVVMSFQKNSEKKDLNYSLTPREEEILKALAEGKRDKEIAEDLFISVDTVHSHLRKIYEKLHVRSRTEAVIKYIDK